MAIKSSIIPQDDWERIMQHGLQGALAMSIEIMGRTGEEACRHAIILMAQSARHLAKQAPARRPVDQNIRFKHLLKKSQYARARMRGNDMSRYYRFAANRLMQPPKSIVRLYANQKRKIARIGNRGLAKRSWMWGLRSLGAPSEGRPIAGVAQIGTVKSQNVCGYLKTNRLSYIQEAMPAGWETAVEQAVTNKIMAQAAMKMERRWVSQVGKANRAIVRPIESYFLKAT